MTPPAQASGRDRHIPGLVNAAATLVVLIAVMAVALRSSAAAPPSVAEFAPVAQHPIKSALDELTSRFGSALGGAASPTPPSPSPDSTHLQNGARAYACVGDPPRQIEDPQSPPCVTGWVGNNGGNTSRGVTANDIVVAVPFNGTNGSKDDPVPGYERFFNDRFEFYGRHLKLVDVTAHTGGGGNYQQPAQEAAATYIDKQLSGFASTDWTTVNDYYGIASAAHHTVVALSSWPDVTEAQMASLDPYVWLYPTGPERELQMMGEWVCARFANHKAVHAGSPTLQLTPRKFGMWNYKDNSAIKIDFQPLKDALARCGEQLAAEVTPDNSSAQSSETAVAELQKAGVTSIIFLGNWANVPMAEATAQGYFPEWLFGSFAEMDTDDSMVVFSTPEQRQNTMGLTFRPRQTALGIAPWWTAVREEDPQWGTSQQDSDSAAALYVAALYRSILLLASGMQMAGPHLTPQTFGAAMHRTIFPNPYVPTLNEGSVGFGSGVHYMVQDAAEWWWSNSAAGPYNDSGGTFCYVDHGARRAAGQFPVGGDPWFQPPCDG